MAVHLCKLHVSFAKAFLYIFFLWALGSRRHFITLIISCPWTVSGICVKKVIPTYLSERYKSFFLTKTN
jgi:hypothetical protein